MPILHAVVFQGAMALVHRPHYPQQSVVGRAHGGQQHITTFQGSKQGAGDGMGAVNELDAHQCGLGAEDIGVDFVQLVPAQVIVAVASGAGKIAICHPVLLKGSQHPGGVLLGDGVNAGKFLGQLALGLVAQSPDTVVYQ